MNFSVNGVARKALLHIPPEAAKRNSPVVFVYHGHGGNALKGARQMPLHRHMPHAICVYPQGLKTAIKQIDPTGSKSGWQHGIGDYGDRDLKFFDAILARLQRDYKVDSARIFCTGHSNGGAFTFLLWAARGSVFAAVAPTSAAPLDLVPRLAPKTAMYVGGTGDKIVRFQDQQQMVQAVRRVNRCNAQEMPWHGKAKLYPSEAGTPFVTYLYPGGHALPDEASALIADFFQQHPVSPARIR